jgi:ABC-type antimicrobial peptide transport system permease subunit
MKLSVILLCALVAVQAALLAAPSAEASGLKVGYYNRKCKGVEAVVKGHIIRAMKKNPRVGAALVRLVFHDCFVRVCLLIFFLLCFFCWSICSPYSLLHVSK